MTEINRDYLFRKYGYCIIPKNTLLYRGFDNAEITECMYFALKFWVAGAPFCNPRDSKHIQIWKVKRDIKVIFLVENVNDRAWSKSAIPKIYNDLFPEEFHLNLNDLDIKQKNFKRRDKFTSLLLNMYNITGWLSSIEGNIELEVCLFGKSQLFEYIKLFRLVDEDEEGRYYKNSLKQIKIVPTDRFMKRVKKLLSDYYIKYSKEKYPYKAYLRQRREWLMDDLLKGEDEQKIKHDDYTIRNKLRI